MRQRAQRAALGGGGRERDQLEAPLVHVLLDADLQLRPQAHELRAPAEHACVVGDESPERLLPRVHGADLVRDFRIGNGIDESHLQFLCWMANLQIEYWLICAYSPALA